MKRFLSTLVFVAVLVTSRMVEADGGDNNLIHACVQKSSQIVRIVDANEFCRATETPLHWSTGTGEATKRIVIEGARDTAPEIIIEGRHWIVFDIPEIDLSDMPLVQVYVRPTRQSRLPSSNAFVTAADMISIHGRAPIDYLAFEEGRVLLLSKETDGTVFFTDFIIVIVK